MVVGPRSRSPSSRNGQLGALAVDLARRGDEDRLLLLVRGARARPRCSGRWSRSCGRGSRRSARRRRRRRGGRRRRPRRRARRRSPARRPTRSCRRTPGSSLRWRMLSIAPVERSSRTWTSCAAREQLFGEMAPDEAGPARNQVPQRFLLLIGMPRTGSAHPLPWSAECEVGDCRVQGTSKCLIRWPHAPTDLSFAPYGGHGNRFIRVSAHMGSSSAAGWGGP